MKKIKDRKKILIVEDDEDLLSTIVEYLEKQGFQVITALNGVDGFKLIESETYDLVITDIDMPIVSGIGVILAHKKRNPEIPIIAMSGYGNAPLEAAREKGADLILRKPFVFSVLMNHLDKLLISH